MFYSWLCISRVLTLLCIRCHFIPLTSLISQISTEPWLLISYHQPVHLSFPLLTHKLLLYLLLIWTSNDCSLCRCRTWASVTRVTISARIRRYRRIETAIQHFYFVAGFGQSCCWGWWLLLILRWEVFTWAFATALFQTRRLAGKTAFLYDYRIQKAMSQLKFLLDQP